MSKFYPATALIGGGTGALDSIDGAGLANGDTAFVTLLDDATYGTIMLAYVLDTDSDTAESVPSVISPDDNAGTKRWVLSKEPAPPSRLELTADTVITAAQLLANRYITNQGAAGQVDITLPAVSYSITRTIIVEEAQIIEVGPPAGEIFDLDGTLLDANDCVDSPATVGAKMVATRMKDAAGAWHWSLDTIRGLWSEDAVLTISVHDDSGTTDEPAVTVLAAD